MANEILEKENIKFEIVKKMEQFKKINGNSNKKILIMQN